jgi:uncharacterized protein YbbK (DUF523 family)
VFRYHQNNKEAQFEAAVPVDQDVVTVCPEETVGTTVYLMN